MMNYKDVLNTLSFVFTIFLIVYALRKGLDKVELTVNILYFTTLLLSQVENLKDLFIKRGPESVN